MRYLDSKIIQRIEEKLKHQVLRRMKLEAHKEGRNWLTSKKAIERYIKNRERKR